MSQLESYVESYRKSLASGHNLYVPMVQKFVAFSKGDFSRTTVEKYLDRLREQGYSDGSIRTIWAAIHRFYSVNGIDWPFAKREAPVVREKEVYAPALDNELVFELIDSAKSGKMDEECQWCLLVSTIYGLRRVEIASITDADVKLAERLLFVETAKHGRQRWHLIPEQVLDLMGSLLSSIALPVGNPDYVSRVWWRIEEATSLGKMRREAQRLGKPWGISWHSIRRSLDRDLLAKGLPIPVVMDFLRWKRGGESMPMRYFASNVIGREGIRTLQGPTDEYVDRQVFAVHPFLGRWSSAED